LREDKKLPILKRTREILLGIHKSSHVLLKLLFIILL